MSEPARSFAMTRRTRRLLLTAAVAALTAQTILAQGPPQSASPLVVRDGLATFEVATNVFGTRVHGRSSSLAARAVIRDSGSGLLVENIEASLPAASLKTGIRLRDQHMIKYIFRTADGQVPDVRFIAAETRCTRPDNASYQCPAVGTLSIRNENRPFSIALEATAEGDAYRVRGVSTVLLSAYGIDRPSQFGVSTEDAVKLHVEFVARRVNRPTTSAGATAKTSSAQTPPPQ